MAELEKLGTDAVTFTCSVTILRFISPLLTLPPSQ
jgi:hypothetical protein